MLKDRQKSILEAAILEHIKTARPVSSQELLKNTRLNVSTATVRNDMLSLDKQGYLEQPHTSAGRVPTDKGYRFFVDNMDNEAVLTKSEDKLFARLLNISDADEFIKEFGRAVSHISGIFTAVGAREDEIFYETGFSELLDEPEFRKPDSIKTFGRLVDALDEELHNFFDVNDGNDLEERVFIGQENPWEEARNYSMFLSSWCHPAGFNGFLAMIGPRRTDYKKHKAIIKSVKKLKNA